MPDFAKPLRPSDALKFGLSIGLSCGALDGVLAIRSAGAMIDRAGILAVSLVVDAAAFACVSLFAWLALRAVVRSPLSVTMRHRLIVGLTCIAIASVVFAVAAVVVGASDGEHGEGRSSQPNILLISIDTLRPDHLSAYGYSRDTSPVLQKLAREGVLFREAYSHSTWTLPAHASILTGLNPLAHGVLTREDRLQGYHETLAERLNEEGYETVAWVGTKRWGFVGADYGFASGFTRFHHYPHPNRFWSGILARNIDALLLEYLYRGVGNAHAQVGEVLRWLDVGRTDPFFAFVHFYDVHSKSAILPYEAPEPFRDVFCEGALDDFDFCEGALCASDRLLEIARGRKSALGKEEIEIARCLYDGGIAFMDSELGRLFTGLRARGLYDNTIIVVTSDHGEAFFEHERPLHTTLHEEITRIPMIIRVPGALEGKRASGVVRQSDIAPTLLALIGSRPLEGAQGKSLVDVLTQWNETLDFGVLAVDDNQGGSLIRKGPYVLILHPSFNALDGKPIQELYDVSSDPAQRHNRAVSEPSVVAGLIQRMGNQHQRSLALQKRLAAGETHEKVEVSDEARAGLRALGYTQDEDE